MAYRNDEDALRSRVAELEERLAEAESTITRMRGERPEDPTDEVDAVTGIAKFVHLERELPFEVTDAGLVAISDHLNARIQGGTVSQVGDTLTHRKASYEMRLVRGDGRTTLRAKGDYRPARTMLFLGAPGLALLGGVFAGALLTALRLGPLGGGVGALLGIVGAIALLRWLLQRSMRLDRTNITAAFEGALELAKEHRVVARPRIASNEVQAVEAAHVAAEHAALAEEQALAAEEQALAAEERAATER